jgi:hypothetical protein
MSMSNTYPRVWCSSGCSAFRVTKGPLGFRPPGPSSSGGPICTYDRRGTALVPTARPMRAECPPPGVNGDAGDATGRINTTIRSAGGRKVVGSNPTAPTRRKPAREAGFRPLGGL